MRDCSLLKEGSFFVARVGWRASAELRDNAVKLRDNT